MTKRFGLNTVLLAALFFSLFLGICAQAQTPPKPTRYVTDKAGILDAATANAINSQLEQFEKDTSNQILVAIYPTLPDGADAAQYATDAYNAWGVGQKGKDNGAILFVFINSRKMFIVTGRGLEGALPDAICKRIIRDVITPQFKQGNYAGGVQAGVNAMIAATKGEFTGNGSTVDDANQAQQQEVENAIGIIIFLVIMFLAIKYGNGGGGFGGPVIFTGGGGGYRGGGGGGFGGGGFSGGGGSSAGGGAGGSW